MAEFELWQDEMVVASVVSEDRASARREIEHYAMMYGQDGPVEIREIVRKPRGQSVKRAHPPKPASAQAGEKPE